MSATSKRSILKKPAEKVVNVLQTSSVQDEDLPESAEFEDEEVPSHSRVYSPSNQVRPSMDDVQRMIAQSNDDMMIKFAELLQKHNRSSDLAQAVRPPRPVIPTARSEAREAQTAPPRRSPSSDSESDPEDRGAGAQETHDDILCAGPDGTSYPLLHALEYLEDLPSESFGPRLAGISRPLQRMGSIVFSAFRNELVPSSVATALAENLVSIAGYCQHLAEHGNSSEKELLQFAQLLDSRRARMPIQTALGRLAKLVKPAARQQTPPQQPSAPAAKRVPNGPCPRCGGSGHWGRDCPKSLQRTGSVPVTPLVAQSLPN